MAIRTLRTIPAAAAACAFLCAHPMGNFSVNRLARFEVRPSGVNLGYVLELAEEPAFELVSGWKLDTLRDRAEVERRVAEAAEEWVRGLAFSPGVKARLTGAGAQVREGAGGLPVVRVTMTVALAGANGWMEYEDRNFAGRSGWSEIVVAAGEGVRLEASTHGSEDRSGGLTSFGGRPPRDVRAQFRWGAGTAGSGKTLALPKPGGSKEDPDQEGFEAGTTQGDYLSRLLRGGEMTPWMLIVGLCAAFGLGAAHALSPGHGKSLVAAYLVGSRGTFRHALLLGGLVTFSHTVSVFALGLGVLLFENYLAPDRVIPVLGVISGVSIVLVGGVLMYRRLGALHHCWQHTHGRPHLHGYHSHGHSHESGHSHLPEGEVSLGALITLGVSGGMVPCPSALVLLLTSVALGRVALGLGLLAAFSAGLAVVLTAIGAAVLYARHLVPDRARWNPPAMRYLPVLSAGVVMAIGVLMTGVSLGWIKPGWAG